MGKHSEVLIERAKEPSIAEAHTNDPEYEPEETQGSANEFSNASLNALDLIDIGFIAVCNALSLEVPNAGGSPDIVSLNLAAVRLRPGRGSLLLGASDVVGVDEVPTEAVLTFEIDGLDAALQVSGTLRRAEHRFADLGPLETKLPLLTLAVTGARYVMVSPEPDPTDRDGRRQYLGAMPSFAELVAARSRRSGS
jgi:hypothetical protein